MVGQVLGLGGRGGEGKVERMTYWSERTVLSRNTRRGIAVARDETRRRR